MIINRAYDKITQHIGMGVCVKLGANAMKHVVAGAHLQTPWRFEPAKRPDDRADYCLDNNIKFVERFQKAWSIFETWRLRFHRLKELIISNTEI